MEFDRILAYRKALDDYMMSDIDAFNKVWGCSLFSQGFAKWHLSRFVAADTTLLGQLIAGEAFAPRADAYLVMTRHDDDLAFYVFNAPRGCVPDASDGSTGLRPDAFSVSGNAEFCQEMIGSIINPKGRKARSLKGEQTFSLSVNLITLADSVSLHEKRALRKLAAQMRERFADSIGYSSVSFMARSDVLRKFASHIASRNSDGNNAAGLAKSMVKEIESLADEAFLKRGEQAKLMFLSMVSGVDAVVLSRDKFPLSQLLEKSVAARFEDNPLVGRISHVRFEPGLGESVRDIGQEAEGPTGKAALFIPEFRTSDEAAFFKLLDSSPVEFAPKSASRPIRAIDLIHLREKAKRVSVPLEIKRFIFMLRGKFESYQSNAVNAFYDISDGAWVDLVSLFRMSAVLCGRKEVDYGDLLLVENAARSIAADKADNGRWASKLIKEALREEAFMPLRLRFAPGFEDEGSFSLADSNAVGFGKAEPKVSDGSGEDDARGLVWICDSAGESLEIRITDMRIAFKKADEAYSIKDALDLLEKNAQRLRNLSRKYGASLKRSSFFPNRYHHSIFEALEVRLNENSANMSKLEKILKKSNDG